MQQQRKHENREENEAASARIIPIHRPSSTLNAEFEQQIQSIRSLIGKLHPNARKQYFDAFLDHLLALDVVYPFSDERMSQVNPSSTSLTMEQHCLIKELSSHLEVLRNEAGDQ